MLGFAVDDQPGNPTLDSDEGPSRRTPNGNGKGRRATDAQFKAIRAIASERGVSGQQLRDLLKPYTLQTRSTT